jgi:hypothetical protein
MYILFAARFIFSSQEKTVRTLALPSDVTHGRYVTSEALSCEWSSNSHTMCRYDFSLVVRCHMLKVERLKHARFPGKGSGPFDFRL